MSRIAELFGHYRDATLDWRKVVQDQQCPFLVKKCIKVRKSQPDVSIGTCTVNYGMMARPVIICPHRFTQGHQVFIDCLHLLTGHQPGNELHVISEIAIPGGSVDYFLVSSHHRKVRDFVGLELQTLDTTGSVWPQRQRFLLEKGIPIEDLGDQTFGMNWKMTAKTILVQLHHKVETFEHLHKHLVLVIQDSLADYMKRQFNFAHLTQARIGDPMQIHTYDLDDAGHAFGLQLKERFSTDAAGIARCLGLQADAKVELATVVEQLERKMSDATRIQLGIAQPLGPAKLEEENGT